MLYIVVYIAYNKIKKLSKPTDAKRRRARGKHKMNMSQTMTYAQLTEETDLHRTELPKRFALGIGETITGIVINRVGEIGSGEWKYAIVSGEVIAQDSVKALNRRKYQVKIEDGAIVTIHREDVLKLHRSK